MRPSLLATILALTLALGARARAEDVGADAARSYRLETSGTTRRLAKGGAGKLVLSIVPLKGTHVHPDAPLKVALLASPGLRLSREELGHADAVDPRAEGPRFEVGFTALDQGEQEATAKVSFFICSDRWCVRQSREIRVAIAVN